MKKQKFTMMVLDRQTGKIDDTYDFGRVLGEGSYGVCKEGTHKKTGEKVAIKTISKRKIVSETEARDIRNEVLVMETVANHDNIVRIYGAYEDSDSVHIVLELCSGGDLFESIIAKGRYSEKDCAELCRQMLEMLDHCHKSGVVHRDLKPENFLLHTSKEGSPLKATDFGLSCFFKLPGELKEPCGTPMYVAPEVIKGKYTSKADVWSAGVILYILLSGKVPFYGKSDEEILRATLKGRYNIQKDPWPHISDAAKECVRSMLTVDPEKRPDAAEMLGHPWIIKDGIANDQPLVSSVIDNLTAFNKMNKFKARAVQIMATNMKEADLARVRKSFDAVDLDKSGNITVDEMRVALESLGNKVAEEQLQQMWSTYDLDGNGMIDYEEFLAATSDMSKINTAENLRYAFREFDKDGNDSISVDEVMFALKHVGIEEKSATEFINDADLNHDGVIDYEEFVTMMSEKEKTPEAAHNVKTKYIRTLTNKILNT